MGLVDGFIPTTTFVLMPLNKLALIRYKVIDQCLRNRARKWTLEDLIEKVSDALYDLEGIRGGVSKRTVQLDLQTMRSDKLYAAPIVVNDKKYYTYEDPKFSIANVKLSDADLQTMNSVLGILKQLNGLGQMEEMGELIARLENNVQRTQHQGRNIIQFEANPLLRGIQWIDALYKAIANERAILVAYRSFRAQTATDQIYYPYLLKEYRNRWFLVGASKKRMQLLTLALDRIEGVKELGMEPFVPYPEIDFETYYNNTIGVTKSETSRTMIVLLAFEAEQVPYVLTKPLHSTQTIQHEMPDGRTMFRIEVVHNFELEREILGFGAGVEVISPRFLRNRIRKILYDAVEKYANEKKEDV
jgi:predicted DNA-binding transcriptional regulator YafY